MATKQEKEILSNLQDTIHEMDRSHKENNHLRFDEISRQLTVSQLLSEDIADSLRMIAGYLAPESPNFRRSLATWDSFDWSSINAKVIRFDEGGPAVVAWNGHHFKRRSGDGKYGRSVWFSRATGKGENGAEYAILIRFRDYDEPEPLTDSIEPGAQAEQDPKPTPKWAETQEKKEKRKSRGKNGQAPATTLAFKYGDKTAVPQDKRTRALFSSFVDQNGFVPAHSDMLKEWYKMQKAAADAEAEEE